MNMHELVTGDDLAAIRNSALANAEALNEPNAAGLPPLYTAALHANRAAVDLLLELGAKVDIFAAAYLGRAADADRLLAADAALAAAATPDQMTPLHYAARAGHADVARTLLRHGADPNARDKSERTPLVEACHGGPWKPGLAEDVIDLLLPAGADVDIHTAAGNGAR